MNSLAAVLLAALLVLVAALLERNQRRTGDLPRTPYGLDGEDDDLRRTRSEVDANRDRPRAA